MRNARVFVTFVAMALAKCASLPQPVLADHPRLVLRSSRILMLPGTPLTLTAEVVGPDVEAWYCPRVVWRWPDGTESTSESDCPEWAPGVEAPRRWTRSGTLGAPGRYVFEVRLEKPKGRVLSRQSIELTAVGGE